MDIYLKLVFIINFIGQKFVMKIHYNRVLSKKCQCGWIKKHEIDVEHRQQTVENDRM